MLKLKHLAFAAGVAAAGFANAQTLKIEKYVLPNGFTVILQEDHRLPKVEVNIWYHVGSKDEPAHRTGFAHLFEHLMFMGTKRVPRGQFDAIMEAGGGDNNADTAEDRTEFYDNGPSTLLPTLLWLEADRLETLGRDIDQAKLDLQREVVKNELRQSYENAPYGNAYLAVNPLIYPEGHPYHLPVIGLKEDLDAATLKDVQSFFATFYVPNNASMVVAGDFKSAEVKPLIAKLFGTIPRQSDPIHRVASPAPLDSVRRITLVDERITQPKVIMVWHSPKGNTPGDVNMDLTAGVLGDEVTGRLYQRLVSDTGLASDISVYQDSLLLGSQFFIDITVQPGADLGEVERQTDAVLKQYTTAGPSAPELQRQAAKAQVSLLSSLQSLENRAQKLNEMEAYFGDPSAYQHVVNMFKAATPSEVLGTAREVLNLNARLVMRVIAQPVAANADNPRDARPGVPAEVSFEAPLPQTFTLSNGIHVSYWRRPELPLMSMTTLFQEGSSLDPVGKGGAANLASEMISQGEGDLDAEGFQNALSSLGATFQVATDRLDTTASLSVLAGNFDQALSLYAGGLRNPRFTERDWKRILDTSVAELQRDEQDPPQLASIVASEALYGRGSLFGEPASGRYATASAVTLPEAKAVWRQVFRPDDATIFVAGSLDSTHVRKALEQALGAWSRQGAVAKMPRGAAFAESDAGLRVVVVDVPQAVQTVIRFLMPAPKYSDPARLRLKALSSLFGEAFTSRLNANLREDKGYTYGAFSSFDLNRLTGTFSASSDVRADVTGPALREFLREIERIREATVTDAETTKAREAMRSAAVQSIESLDSLVQTAANLQSEGVDFAALNRDLAATGQMRTADINAIAHDAIPLEKGVLVLVGDKATILAQIKDLGLGTPIIVKP
jgi:predicted Zn-dependent peptidase